MPRGVYDRTLSKEERAVMKAAKDKKAAKGAPKRKYTRRVPVEALKGSSNKSQAKSMTSTSDGVIAIMNEVRNNLATLANVRSAFGEMPSLADEAQAQVQVLGQLRDKLVEVEAAAQAVTEDENVQNGVSGQDSVPLVPPPQIVTALPTPH